MYATHPTIVDHETFTFQKRGIDVYTAAWATNTRSMWKAENIHFLSSHPYQGKCDFLSDETIETLSKIDVKMMGAKFIPEVQTALLDNFDILYVSQITPWVMLYSEEFLKQGRHVIFRTFGYPLRAWGTPNDISPLCKYSTFHILPTDPAEIEVGVYSGLKNVHQIMASIHSELLDITIKLDNCDKFTLTVIQIPLTAEITIRQSIEKSLPWVCVNRDKSFVPQYELERLFNSCEFYLDPTYNLLRYSVFEAIMHNRPVLVIRDKDMHKFMKKTGFSCGLETTFNGWDDIDRVGFYAKNHGAVEQLFQAQTIWFNRLLKEAEVKWDNFIEEIA